MPLREPRQRRPRRLVLSPRLLRRLHAVRAGARPWASGVADAMRVKLLQVRGGALVTKRGRKYTNKVVQSPRIVGRKLPCALE